MRKILTSLILLGAGVWVGWCASQAVPRRSAAPRAVMPRGPLPAMEQSVVDRFKEARVSVVYLTSLAYQQDFWSLDVQTVPTGTGSGFVWDDSTRADLGFDPIPDAWAASLDVPKGIIVGRVRRGGPADRAGLRGLTRQGGSWLLGDVILGANGQLVKDMDKLLDLVEMEKPGSVVTLEVYRQGKKVKLQLTVAVDSSG